MTSIPVHRRRATVVVAPNPHVDTVVATAWTWRASCATPHVDALLAFVEDHADAGSQMSPG